MHINYQRGETREFVYRRESERYHDKLWRQWIHEFKVRRATYDVEEPRHRPRRKPRKFVGTNGGEFYFKTKFATERARDEAARRHEVRKHNRAVEWERWREDWRKRREG